MHLIGCNYKMSKNCIIFLVGPTCSRKTAISLELSKYFPIEIISADSMQVYKNMDIGTAKATVKERNIVPHHLIDIVETSECFSAYAFRVKALKIIKEILSRNKIPLIVGGSGLYIKALLDGLKKYNSADIKLREALELQVNEQGLKSLYEKLRDLNKNMADKIHCNDKKRIIRALEINTLSKSNLVVEEKSLEDLGYSTLLIGLDWDRNELYEAVEKRVDQMIDIGLVDEVKNIAHNLSQTTSQAVGYKEIIAYLNNEMELVKAVVEIKKNTRHLVKKQLTWFRKEQRIKWVKAGRNIDLNETVNTVKDLINNTIYK